MVCRAGFGEKSTRPASPPPEETLPPPRSQGQGGAQPVHVHDGGGRTRDSHKLPRISLRLVISPATTCHSSSSSPISLHLLYLPNSGSAGALLNGYRGHLLPPGAETALCSRKPAPLFTLLGPAELGHRMARDAGLCRAHHPSRAPPVQGGGTAGCCSAAQARRLAPCPRCSRLRFIN